MMHGVQFVKAIFGEPNLPDEIADSILWSCTGYPTFFHGKDTIKECAYQLRHAKRAMKRGFTMDQIYVGEDVCKGRVKP